jgi:polynucleotide 5'-hydroxyl-kinase GRC3/NOL9
VIAKDGVVTMEKLRSTLHTLERQRGRFSVFVCRPLVIALSVPAMLSAVAARKAAKAAAGASVTPSSKLPSPPPPSKSPSQSPQPTRRSESDDPPTSKRKPRVSVHAGSSKNKKVKVVHAPAKPVRNTRYFDLSDTSNAQNGVLVDDPTCKIQVSSESDSSSEEEMDMDMDIPPPVGLSSISVANTKRAWSPSRPIPDSSDDEEPCPSGSFDPAGYLTPSTPMKPELLTLSTFFPVPNGNVYSVPENEYATSGKARILVLQPNETLALVGTYSFCVLQGSLSLLGVTLSPSNTKHTVFAPRSSPIPILSWATLDHQGSCTFLIPPAIRQQAKTTVILLEYADTGVEGLGRICKVFENALKPPREPDAVPGLDLPRIHIVCV